MLARIIYILKAYHINKLCPKKSNLSIVLCERAKGNVINFQTESARMPNEEFLQYPFGASLDL